MPALVLASIRWTKRGGAIKSQYDSSWLLHVIHPQFVWRSFSREDRSDRWFGESNADADADTDTDTDTHTHTYSDTNPDARCSDQSHRHSSVFQPDQLRMGG